MSKELGSVNKVNIKKPRSAAMALWVESIMYHACVV